MSNIVPPQANLSTWYCGDFSGCGYLRTILPNEYLNSVYGNSKKYEGLVSSRFLLEKSILPSIKNIHLQRQITNDQLKFIEAVKQIRDKHKLQYQIIYDVDDLYFNVPSYNNAGAFYNQPFIKENLQRIVNLVDVFTVSTYDLKKEIEAFKGTCKVKIVPNYVPKYIYRPYEFPKPPNEKPKIIWAGSATHFNDFDTGDLGLILDLIKNTVDEFDWIIMGLANMPPWLACLEGKVKLMKWVRHIHSVPTILKELNIDFGLAPLLDNPFNRAKSNIKLLDYASADIISIATKLPPYKESQLFLQGDWKADRDQIIEIFQNKVRKEEILNKQQRLLDKYFFENNVKKYKELFKIQ